MARPRILLSNDDGVEAPGILALAKALGDWADLWIVAPDRERSATSHSISLHKPLRIKQLAPQRYCVDGTPTDCVYLALHHILPEPPHMVISGINHGANVGNDVLYSGTISAAMEGALFGYPAMALSLCYEAAAPEVLHFDTAGHVALDLAQAVLSKSGMPKGVLLNVNVPSRPVSQLKGIKVCRLGYTPWANHVDMRQDPRGRPYYWIGGDRQGAAAIDDSDTQAVHQGYVSVTPVHYDLTDHRSFAYIRDLPFKHLPHEKDFLGDAPLPHVMLGLAADKLPPR